MLEYCTHGQTVEDAKEAIEICVLCGTVVARLVATGPNDYESRPGDGEIVCYGSDAVRSHSSGGGSSDHGTVGTRRTRDAWFRAIRAAEARRPYLPSHVWSSVTELVKAYLRHYAAKGPRVKPAVGVDVIAYYASHAFVGYQLYELWAHGESSQWIKQWNKAETDIVAVLSRDHTTVFEITYSRSRLVDAVGAHAGFTPRHLCDFVKFHNARTHDPFPKSVYVDVLTTWYAFVTAHPTRQSYLTSSVGKIYIDCLRRRGKLRQRAKP